MRTQLFSCLALLLISVTTNVTAQTMRSSDQNKPIIVKSSSPEVTVTLAANKTTGYSWFLSSYNSSLVEPLRYKYSAAQNKTPGAAGESTWTFRIREPAFTVPHLIKIHLVYRRPWETKNAQIKTVTIITQ